MRRPTPKNQILAGDRYPPAVSLGPERDHPDRYVPMMTGERIWRVLLRIAADIDELARARRPRNHDAAAERSGASPPRHGTARHGTARSMPSTCVAGAGLLRSVDSCGFSLDGMAGRALVASRRSTSELVRVRPDLDPVGLLAPELDVGGDQVVGEDPTVGEKRVVGLERVERLVERCRDGGDVRELLGRERPRPRATTTTRPD